MAYKNENVFSCGSDPQIFKCSNCKSEVRKKDLKETSWGLDIQDGYEEHWYKCPICGSDIVVYYS